MVNSLHLMLNVQVVLLLNKGLVVSSITSWESDFFDSGIEKTVPRVLKNTL